MNDQKILEAIENLIKEARTHAFYMPDRLAKEILTAIRHLLPPSDLVKVWEGESLVISSNGDKPYDTEIILSYQKKKHIEVYIREVKS